MLKVAFYRGSVLRLTAYIVLYHIAIHQIGRCWFLFDRPCCFSTGFPEHMPFGEFRRRFDILAASQFRNTGPVLDEKKVSWNCLGVYVCFVKSSALSIQNNKFPECTSARVEFASGFTLKFNKTLHALTTLRNLFKYCYLVFIIVKCSFFRRCIRLLVAMTYLFVTAVAWSIDRSLKWKSNNLI